MSSDASLGLQHGAVWCGRSSRRSISSVGLGDGRARAWEALTFCERGPLRGPIEFDRAGERVAGAPR